MTAQNKPISGTFSDALLTTAMIDEMARADHWQGMDECMAIKPEVLKDFSRYAEAALRALKRFEQSGVSVIRPH